MNRQHDLYKPYASDDSICMNNLCSQAVAPQLIGQRKTAPTPSSETTSNLYTLYLFMERWTCSRCWLQAKALGQIEEWLADHEITVVLVGPNHYLQQANQLARELHLPFRLFTDEHGSLKRFYGFGECGCDSHQQNLLLVENKGCVSDWRRVQASGKKRQIGAI
jgi:peroxiredoxin